MKVQKFSPCKVNLMLAITGVRDDGFHNLVSIVAPVKFGDAQDYISRLKLLIFKPDFSINTGWAYSQMKANPSDYIDPDEAESLISVWLENPSISGLPLVNNMQIEAFKKYPALELAVEGVREKFNIPAMMSGSGSACFAIVNNLEETQISELEKFIKSMLGESCFLARA